MTILVGLLVILALAVVFVAVPVIIGQVICMFSEDARLARSYDPADYFFHVGFFTWLSVLLLTILVLISHQIGQDILG